MKYVIAIILFFASVSARAQLVFKEYSNNSQQIETDLTGIGFEWGESFAMNRRIKAEYKYHQNLLIIEQETNDRWVEERKYIITGTIAENEMLDGRSGFSFSLKSTISGKIFSARYVPEQYLTIVNSVGEGFYYWLQPAIPAPSFQKVTTNYLLPDGKTFYAFNTGVNLTSWIYNSEKVEAFKYIYPLDYEIIDSGTRSLITFSRLTDYSAILLEKKTTMKGDTIVLEIANVLSEERIPKKALKHSILYPPNFKVVHYEAAAKGKWQNSNNMLLFEADDAINGSAKIYFLKNPEKTTENKKDTVYITEKKTDTIYLSKESKITPKTFTDNREIKEKGTLKLKSKTVEITVWDAATADGDIISLNLNGKWIVQNLKLNNCKNVFVFDLEPGENTLTMRAENLGSSPPNTAKFQFKCGDDKQVIQLRADMGYSEQIKLLVE